MKFRWEAELKETEIGEIPKDWEVRNIEKIGIIGSGTTPSTKNKDYWDGNIPWITPKDLSIWEYRFISKGERNITEKAVKDNSLKIYPSGTVLLTSRAPIGYVAIAGNPVTTNQGFKNIIPKENTNSEFLYYTLKHISEYLKDISGGSTFGELTKEILKNVEIPYPPFPEQSRIATVLSWFDDLIENKKRQNEILEKTAMAIFKNWFIDFEPFKNSQFVYNEELGKEIPKGWEVKKLIKNLKDIISGRGRYIIESNSGEYPLWGANGILGHINEYDLEGFAILTGRVGTIGNVFLVCEKFAISDNVLCCVPKSTFHVFFIYFWLKILVDFESLNVGSSQPLITKTMLGNEIILMPPPPILQSFHSLVEPLFQKIILNQKQIMLLRKIRDRLLPLLVFGKLRVEEI